MEREEERRDGMDGEREREGSALSLSLSLTFSASLFHLGLPLYLSEHSFPQSLSPSLALSLAPLHHSIGVLGNKLQPKLLGE